MVQFNRNIWTLRFLLIAGLVLLAQIIVGITAAIVSAQAFAPTEMALSAFLLLCGVGVLRSLDEPLPRKIVLGAGFFVLLGLLTLVALQTTGRIPAANALRL